jgi:hypothetical protein
MNQVYLNKFTSNASMRFRWLLRSGYRRSALIGLGWYLLLHIVFVVGFGVIQSDQPNVDPDRPHILQAVKTFDSPFYEEIAEDGYKNGNSITHLAFYPLYPAILHMLSVLSLQAVDVRVISFVLNGLFVMATASVVYLVSVRLKLRHPTLVVLAWLLFPWSVFMGAIYTEALFCLLVATVLLLVLKNNWYLAALVAGLASATRLPGILLGFLVVFEFSRQVLLPRLIQNKLDINNMLKAILLTVLSSLGLASWLGYQWIAFGSPFAFQEAYRILWTYHVFSLNILAPLVESGHVAIQGLVHKNIESELFEVGSWLFAFSILIASVVLRLRVAVGWLLFIALNLTLIILNSNTVSINRYILPILPIFILLIMLIERVPVGWVRKCLFIFYFIACVAIQLVMAIRLVNFAWVG